MTTTAEYLSSLRERGVRVEAAGDELKVRAPGELLTEDLRSELRRRKPELLRFLTTKRTGTTAPPPLEPREGAGPAPASFAQERLWFLNRLDPDSVAYNRPYAFRFRGALDVGALEWALGEILRRHEALRTRIIASEGEPLQEVVDVGRVELPVVEVEGESVEEREAALREALWDHARRPFDLGRAPLIRFALFRLGADDHVLFHNTHHVVSDGWSTGVFHRELDALYRARVGNEEPDLDPLPIQYGDFARWQRDWLRGEALEERLAWWREHLSGELPVMELPLDRSRPATESHRGDRVGILVPDQLVEAVAKIGREEGATLYMTLLAAFQALLRHYTGQDDLVVGVPVAGRIRSELEGLVGLFINTLPLRVDTGGDPPFRALLARTRSATVEAFGHQDLPFERLVQELQPERTMSHHPLYQVMFSFQDYPDHELDLPGLDVEQVHVERGAALLDLEIMLGRTEEGLRVVARYAMDLFDRETVENLLRHYRTLLEGVARSPDERISALPVLDQAERARILTEWNETGELPEGPETLVDAFREQAERTPDRVALVTPAGEELSYRELQGRARRLAARLRKRGVGSGDMVGVATGRNAHMVTALLGILQSGAAYLPLDPGFPGERLELMLRDSGTELVLTDGEGGWKHPAGAEAELMELPIEGEEAEVEEIDLPSVASEDLAYAIYTSGSTGRPKGVLVEHGSATSFLRSMASAPGLDADDRLLAVTTLSFDIHVLEIFLPLMTGATVVLADSATSADGRPLLRKLRDEGITVMQATPVSWRLLLEAGWEGDPAIRVLSGGEAMPVDLARALAERAPEVWNLYGPTEATVWATRYRLPESGEPVLIGRPLENTRAYVLDEHGQPVPPGVVGELHLGGSAVARGYHRRPELTRERFVPDPFVDEAGARMYRTGDQARHLRDGTLDFLGRRDRQVKVRGFRIELGEVESALSDHPDVEQAAAVVREDHLGEKRLVAYAVYRPGHALTTSEMRRHLQGVLPAYMVPSLIVDMEELPLTPNGKVDRKALPDPLSGPDRNGDRRESPESQSEKLVADLWQEALDVDEVGRRDNFFDLGGHSLLSMRVLYRLEERTGLDLNPRIMIVNTLEQIAAEVDRARQDG